MDELNKKVILITGASRGIGKGIAAVCAREGACVIVSSIEKELTDEIANNLPGGLAKHSSLYLDVTQEADRQNAFDFILKKYGRLDGLVNNAGIDFSKPFLQTSYSEWRKVLSVDLDAIFALCQLAITQFLKQGGGSIVNISSVHTISTYQGSGPYAAAKGALNMLTKSLTCEFAKDNIRINCIAPGVVRTEIWQAHIDAHGSEEAALKYWAKNIPSGRLIEPEDVGELASFLLSNRAIHINGSIFYLDGGLTSQLIANE